MSVSTYEYALIRLLPRVERQEFINVGIVFSCQQKRVLQVKYELDRQRLRALDPSADPDFIEAHLHSLKRVCQGEGPLGQLSLRERFHWLVAPRSTILQLSPVHSGQGENLEACLEQLFERLVRVRPQT